MSAVEQLSFDGDKLPPPIPPTTYLPTLPLGTGFTAMEAAEAIVLDSDEWRKRETIRRRVQELAMPYGLLLVVGQREGAKTKKDNQVYAVSDIGREAYTTWLQGVAWKPLHLARSFDPETAKKAARTIRPAGDFQKVLKLFVEGG